MAGEVLQAASIAVMTNDRMSRLSILSLLIARGDLACDGIDIPELIIFIA
jgi:hypothetical protein